MALRGWRGRYFCAPYILICALFARPALGQAAELVAADKEKPTIAAGLDDNDRGGSFTLEPALLMPAGALAKIVDPGMGANVNFDIGFTPRWSMIFGGAFYDLRGKANPDLHLVFAPAWMGLRHKAQFQKWVEVFGDLSLSGTYVKAFLTNSGTGAIETLDAGGIVGAGIDLIPLPWLVIGVSTRVHLVIEPGQVYPFFQTGLRLGVRG